MAQARHGAGLRVARGRAALGLSRPPRQYGPADASRLSRPAAHDRGRARRAWRRRVWRARGSTPRTPRSRGTSRRPRGPCRAPRPSTPPARAGGCTCEIAVYDRRAKGKKNSAKGNALRSRATGSRRMATSWRRLAHVWKKLLASRHQRGSQRWCRAAAKVLAVAETARILGSGPVGVGQSR